MDPASDNPTGGPQAGPLTPEQLAAVADAKRRRKRIDRAAGVAAFGGWATAVLAVLGTPFAFFDWLSAVVVIGLAVVAYHEFKGRRLLKALDPDAPRLLGLNQLGFAGLIIAYSGFQIVTTLTGAGPYAEAIAAEPMLADTLGPIEDVLTWASLAVYATLMVGTILFQGGTAWYYFSRARHLRDYLEQTPRWVNDLIRAGA